MYSVVCTAAADGELAALWITAKEALLEYDELADVIYVNFEPGVEATDSELGADDVIVRYRGDEVIGPTILHASRRSRVNGK